MPCSLYFWSLSFLEAQDQVWQPYNVGYNYHQPSGATLNLLLTAAFLVAKNKMKYSGHSAMMIASSLIAQSEHLC